MSTPFTPSTPCTLSSPTRAVPPGTLFLRRARSLPLLVAAVVYAWSVHLRHLIRCRFGQHCGDAGMTTAVIVALAVSRAGRVALSGAGGSRSCRTEQLHRVPFDGHPDPSR